MQLEASMPGAGPSVVFAGLYLSWSFGFLRATSAAETRGKAHQDDEQLLMLESSCKVDMSAPVSVSSLKSSPSMLGGHLVWRFAMASGACSPARQCQWCPAEVALQWQSSGFGSLFQRVCQP